MFVREQSVTSRLFQTVEKYWKYYNKKLAQAMTDEHNNLSIIVLYVVLICSGVSAQITFILIISKLNCTKSVHYTLL